MSEAVLQDLIEPVIAGFWGEPEKTTSNTSPCRVVRNGDVAKDGKIQRRGLPIRYFSDHEIATASIQDGDIILVSSGAYTGNAGVVVGEDDDLPVVVSNFVRRLRPRLGTDAAFLYHLVRSQFVQKSVPAHTGGSAIPNLQSSFYRGCHVPGLPREPAQRRIAEILSTVDEAIEHTETLIAKTQQIKTGLMHDLFTRGVTPDGRLRPPQDQAPELYKQSALGWIPREWKAQKLSAILETAGGHLQTGPFGSQLHAYEYSSEGVPVIMPQDIVDGEIDTRQIARIPESRATDLEKHRLREGDVVIARRGDLSRAAATRMTQADWVCGTGCFLLRLGGSRFDPFFAANAYRHEIVQRQLDGKAVGTTMPSLNNSVMGSLIFPFPSDAEQARIENRMISIEERAELNRQFRRALQSIKSGLAKDLLQVPAREPANSKIVEGRF